MFNVCFDNISSYDDLGLVFLSKTISEPEAQTKMVNITGRNGSIDLTEVVSGNVRYNDRTIKMTFEIMKPAAFWEITRAEIAQKLHGQKFRIVFDDDLAFYWLGRVNVGDLKPNGSTAELELTAVVNPYKYTIQSTAEDWLWDPFDFELGVIQETSGLVVNGSLEVSIECSPKWENPIIISDSAMSVSFDGETFPVAVGSQVMYGIIFEEGTNTLTFAGNGTVTVSYVGGML